MSTTKDEAISFHLGIRIVAVRVALVLRHVLQRQTADSQSFQDVENLRASNGQTAPWFYPTCQGSNAATARSAHIIFSRVFAGMNLPPTNQLPTQTTTDAHAVPVAVGIKNEAQTALESSSS